jgi:hypothetical protein
MTIEAYNRATKILEEKQQLENQLRRLRENILVDFSYTEEYVEISNKLFKLGQEFAAL